jgi:kumamolisin
MSQTRIAIAGSRRVPVAGAARVGPVDSHERVEATIVLRRSPKLTEPSGQIGVRVRRADFAAAHGADPHDMEIVERFAHEHGLTVVASHAGRRTVHVAGPADAMKAAFGTQLSYYESPEGRYRGRIGAVTLPDDVAPVVEAVLGLDNRPIAKPHLRRHAQPETADGALFPTQVATAYNFPATVNGNGETIAILELGGGFKPQDLETYFGSLKIPTPKVSAIGVLTGTNNPGQDPNADGEVMLDIEVAGAVAPGARIVVYFAPNTDQGFHDAIATAVHDDVNKPSVISISWGSAEANWTPQARKVMNAALQDAAALGVTVTVAAGDDGSSDGLPHGEHVDFPASSPFALACGGTKLEVTASGSIQGESVWNEQGSGRGATGGGFSAVFNLPDYQRNSNASKHGKMRGVPDVSGNADPTTGYRVLVDGSMEVIGGTSAVSPLWAGLVALLNQQTGSALGFLNPALYAKAAGGFHDIVTGDNGSFKAGPGWDATTGLGTPDAKHLALAGVATT